MMSTMKVKFFVNRTVRDFRAGTPDEECFKAGKVYDLPESSARHWINRGVAEEAQAASKTEPEDKPAAEEKKRPARSKAKDD